MEKDLTINDLSEEVAVTEAIEEENEAVKEDAKEVEVESKKKRTRKDASKKAPVCDECVETKKSWKEVFLANYNGTSEEAKSLQPHLKTSYKGDIYIPWAVMERLTYMCDENAKFINVENGSGGLVFSDFVENHQLNIQKGETISETKAPMFSHFVKVALVFMGKVFVETYPIQDQDYSAARIFNQNLVNRALQRAKAKVAARATGLGLKLYEGFDLQFDTKEEDKKPELPVKQEETSKKVETTTPKKAEVKKESVVETKPVEKVVEQPKEQVVEEVKETIVEEPKEGISEEAQAIKDLVKIIKTYDENKVNAVLQRVNISIMKKYSFALSTKDTEEDLVEKLSKFPNIMQFKKTIEHLLG